MYLSRTPPFHAPCPYSLRIISSELNSVQTYIKYPNMQLMHSCLTRKKNAHLSCMIMQAQIAPQFKNSSFLVAHNRRSQHASHCRTAQMAGDRSVNCVDIFRCNLSLKLCSSTAAAMMPERCADELRTTTAHEDVSKDCLPLFTATTIVRRS